MRTVPDSIAIVGASHAAVACADALRAHGYTGEVILFSAESHPPYQRPPLSKAWLKGVADAESLLLRKSEHYAENGIELILGTRVVGVCRDDAGYLLTLSEAAQAPTTRRVSRLVLATGARCRRIDLPGADHRDVLVLRDLDDARRLADRGAHGPVVVIGGGFIGLEVAATLQGLGVPVTVVEAAPMVMGRAVGADTARFVLDGHRTAGLDVRIGVAPVEICADGASITGVRLADGNVVPAATVLLGVGACARTELAEQLELDCAGGVVVDDRCHASDGTTVAIGDCTVQTLPGGARVRFESIDNATEQAAVAAAALLGREAHVRGAPWFWSDQGDWKLQMVGGLPPDATALVRTDPSKPRRRVTLYFVDDALVAAECVNAPADFVAIRNALARGYRPGPADLADTTVALKSLLQPVRV